MLQAMCAHWGAFVHGAAQHQLWLDPPGRTDKEGAKSTKEQILVPALRSQQQPLSHAYAAGKRTLPYHEQQEPRGENWLKKKKKLILSLQARIGHAVPRLYVQRIKNSSWIKAEQWFHQLPARAMHSQCSLNPGGDLERGKKSLLLARCRKLERERDCRWVSFIP